MPTHPKALAFTDWFGSCILSCPILEAVSESAAAAVPAAQSPAAPETTCMVCVPAATDWLGGPEEDVGLE